MACPRRPHIIWWGRRGAFLQRIDIQYLQNRRRADPGDRGDACAVVGLGEGYFVVRRVGNCIFIIYVGRGGHSAIGYNYRMSNVCAGIGRGQMTVLDSHIAHHRHVQKLYEELLADVPGVQIHKQPEDGRFESNYWLCAATLDPSVRRPGGCVQGGDQDGRGRCRGCDPPGVQRDHRLPAERECRGAPSVHAEQEGRVPTGLEANAQAACL